MGIPVNLLHTTMKIGVNWHLCVCGVRANPLYTTYYRTACRIVVAFQFQSGAHIRTGFSQDSYIEKHI